MTRKLLHCDCGFEARAEDARGLVEQIQRHALEAHGMALTRAQALVLASRAEPEAPTNGRGQRT